MLLTLNAASLAYRLHSTDDDERLAIEDVPKFALEQLELRGLVIDTHILKGWSLDDLDRFRMRADQAACPCLVLRESGDIPAGSQNPKQIEATLNRVELVARAAQRLGCSALSVCPSGVKDDDTFLAAASFLRGIVERIDRLELNLLIEPGLDRLADAETLIALIKKIGGFRVGTMPNFANALATDDAEATLRQTAPYAGAVLASCGDGSDASASNEATGGGKRSSKKKTTRKTSGSKKTKTPVMPTDTDFKAIQDAVRAIRNVGYGQILAIDFIGEGDGVEVIEATRKAIESVLAEEE